MEQKQQLSRREKEVVNLVLQGKSNKQIAMHLGISERTVEFHLKNVYQKENVSSRIDFVLKLWAATGTVKQFRLGESTVEVPKQKMDNDNQPQKETRWAKFLMSIIAQIKQEVVMTKKIIVKNFGNFFRKHPLIFSLLLLVVSSLVTRYLMMSFGLYFWFSYALSGLLLVVGCLCFGWAWKRVKAGKIYFKPIVVVGVVSLPILVVLVDTIMLSSIAKSSGQVMVNILGISNKAMWLTASDGTSYLYKERIIFHESLWLYATLCMLLLPVIGNLARQGFKIRNLTRES